LRQVWVNLLFNAIKFTKTKETAIIVVSGEEKKSDIEYSAEDNGAGFDIEYTEKLFGVFQRTHTLPKNLKVLVSELNVLKRIKFNPRAKMIPVVAPVSSGEERDRLQSYELGVNSYIIKPADFGKFVEERSPISVFIGSY
jgi:hypothetical protein